MEKMIYPLVVYKESSRNNLWIGNFPGLNGCWVEGSTKEEVLSRAPRVLHEYAKGLRELGLEATAAAPVKELEETGVGAVFIVEEAPS